MPGPLRRTLSAPAALSEVLTADTAQTAEDSCPNRPENRAAHLLPLHFLEELRDGAVGRNGILRVEGLQHARRHPRPVRNRRLRHTANHWCENAAQREKRSSAIGRLSPGAGTPRASGGGGAASRPRRLSGSRISPAGWAWRFRPPGFQRAGAAGSSERSAQRRQSRGIRWRRAWCRLPPQRRGGVSDAARRGRTLASGRGGYRCRWPWGSSRPRSR